MLLADLEKAEQTHHEAHQNQIQSEEVFPLKMQKMFK